MSLTLHEYYQYLQQLPQLAIQKLQERAQQKKMASKVPYKKRLIKKTLSKK